MLPRLCFPDGPVRVKRMSGTPETLHVNAMVPLAKAASGRPDGASVTVSVSTTSAYISFEVWRTFARRHGSAGALEAAWEGALELTKLGLNPDFLHETQESGQCQWS